MQGSLNRRGFLQGAAAASTALWLAGCGSGSSSGGGGTSASHPPIGKEPGKLSIAEWPGYEAGGTKAQTYGMLAGTSYTKKYGADTLTYTDLGNDDKILNQVRAGAKFDIIHPCVGFVHDWVNAGLVQPWDTDELPSFPELYPEMVKTGVVDGKQYFIPWDAGYSSVLYRTDKVDPEDAKSWDIFWNKKYAGKISMWDGGTTPLRIAGLLIGAEDIDAMTSSELDDAKKLLIEQKKVNKFYWTSEYGNMQPAFKSGDIWITYSWANDYKDMRDAGLAVDFMNPKEGPLAWYCGFVLGKDTKNFHHAHRYVESFINKASAKDLTNLFAYANSNSTVKASDIKDKGLAKKLHIGDPHAFDPPVHLEKYIPNRAEYQRIWEEVKAA
jgi:spermidine/putrescine transport system substrate-binding protein